MPKAAGLRHTPGRMKEVPPEMPEMNYVPTPNPEKKVAQGARIIYKLKNNKSGDLHVDGRANNVWNPRFDNGKDEDGKTRPKGGWDSLRLLEGVYTPWVSEQQNMRFIDKEYIRFNIRSLVFKNAKEFCIATVPMSKVAYVEFCENHPQNIASRSTSLTGKHLFFKYDPAVIEAEMLKEEMLVIDAIQKANAVSEGEMRKHCAYIGINPNDTFGTPKTEAGMRREYLVYAKRNPKQFMKDIGTPVLEVAYLISKGIMDGHIDLGRQPNMAYWSHGGGFICVIPKTETAVSYLQQYAMLPQAESKDFLDKLNKLGQV